MSPQRDDWPADPIGPRGAADLTPLVLLHGFMGDAEDWRGVSHALVRRLPGASADDAWGLAPELPGHGRHRLRTDPPLSPEALGFESWASSLVAWLTRQGIERAHLLGYSMGGRLALYTAWRWPERVASLVLEGVNPGISEPQARAARATLDSQRAARILTEGLPSFLDDWYRLDLFADLREHGALYQAMLARRRRQRDDEMATIIEALSPGRQPPMAKRLGEIKAPTLWVAGADDPRYATRVEGWAADMRHQGGRATAALVSGAGHNVHLTRPEAFVDTVARFWTTLSPEYRRSRHKK